MDDGGAAALEKFRLLAKSAKGLAAVALIKQVLSAENIFIFGELLDTESIQALRGTEHEPYLELLKLFTYGTYMQYRESKMNFPPLSPPQEKKLKALSIVTLAEEHQIIPYSLLMKQLDIASPKDMESLIISAIYAGLLRGRMDQQEKALYISYAIGRDVVPHKLDKMIERLKSWQKMAEMPLAEIDENLRRLQNDRVLRRQQATDLQRRVREVMQLMEAQEQAKRVEQMDLEMYEEDQDITRLSVRTKRAKMPAAGRYRQR